MDIELAATHEAGHSVMQWLVGWETIALQMTVRDSNASHVSARCPHPALSTVSALRSRLLVLFAGNASTRQRWPERNNDWGDWLDVLNALTNHFHSKNFNWIPADGHSLRDPELNEIIQNAKKKCEEIVAHRLVQQATEQISSDFANVDSDENGV